MTGQQISPAQLPDVVRKHVDEEVPLVAGVGEIEGMIAQARAKDGWLMFALPNAADIVRLMNHEANRPFQQITSVYWVVSESALVGTIDHVRTTLAELVAEMRAGMPDPDVIPSAAVADQAVNVAVHGNKARVNVTTAQASGNAHHVSAESSSLSHNSRWKKIGGFIVGLATVGVLVVAILQWLGWGL